MEHVEMEKLVNALKDIADIKDALLGNIYTKNEGLVTRVASNEVRLKVIEDRFKMGVWLLLGIGAGAGVGIAKLLGLLAPLLK